MDLVALRGCNGRNGKEKGLLVVVLVVVVVVVVAVCCCSFLLLARFKGRGV